MIQNIAIEKLHGHPDNPRKDIGDITELAESIKASGILQNLTVVPATGYYDGDYIVIIGHRRLAAAKKAGLKELPCAVVEMDQKQQVATMLLENMQRTDLTVYEQAQGMQMMLDLGETLEDISDKTGFSESTIRRRVKLLKLDGDKFKESEARQVSLAEYDKLFEIEDEEKRNELLDTIGTANFNNKFMQAKADDERKRKRDAIIQAVAPYAIQKDGADTNELKYVGHIDNVKDVPTEFEDVQYYYSTSWGAGIYLYREYTEEEKEEQVEEELQKEEKEDKKSQLNDLAERFYKLRFDFIHNYNPKKETDKLMKFATYSFMHNRTSQTSIETMEDLVGEKISKDGQYYTKIFEKEKYQPMVEENPSKMLLFASYSHMHDNDCNDYHDYSGNHDTNESLDMLYECLEMLGYEMSDEEKAYKDGTHELFAKEGE